MRRVTSVFLPVLALAALAACSSPKPVLYPNAQLNSVGKAQADRDIEACEDFAKNNGVSSSGGKGTEMVKDTAVGGGAGAAVGAVAGAVAGGDAGKGAAIGGATGATAGLIRGALKDSGPDSTYRNFVNRCLKDKGYDVVGWSK